MNNLRRTETDIKRCRARDQVQSLFRFWHLTVFITQ